MKKALCIIMALVLLCGTLVACNNVTDDNSGDVSSTAWGCDLTYDYVKINGDYRS